MDIVFFQACSTFAHTFLKVIPLSALLFVGVLSYFVSLSAQHSTAPIAIVSAEERVITSIDRETALFQCLLSDTAAGRSLADCEQGKPAAQAGRGGRIIVYDNRMAEWRAGRCGYGWPNGRSPHAALSVMPASRSLASFAGCVSHPNSATAPERHLNPAPQTPDSSA